MTRVNGNGNGLTPEEIKARREAFNKIKEEGHEIILTARPGKNSGVSYDYMDRLNKDIEAGIFEDNNKDGQKNKFSNYDKRNLGNEFTDVFSEHGYSTRFTRMKAGEQYAITYDDYVRLADAAGYVLKEEEKQEKPAPAPVEKKMPELKPVPFKIPETKFPELKLKPIQPQGPKDVVTWDITETEYPDGSKVRTGSYTVNGKETTVNEAINPTDPAAVEKKEETPVVTDTTTPKEEVVIGDTDSAPQKKKEALEPDAVTPQAKNDTPAAQVPALGALTKTTVEAPVAAPEEKKEVPTAEVKDKTPVAPVEEKKETPAAAEVKDETPVVDENLTAEERLAAEIANDPLLAGKSTEEKLKILRGHDFALYKEARELEKTKVTETKPRFLGLGKKEVERDLTPEELAQNRERLEQIKAEQEKYQRYQVYVDDIEGAEYWTDKIASQELRDKNGDVVAAYPQYYQVTVVDDQGKEHRVARVETYNPETLQNNVKFYSLDVQKVGNPTTSQPLYYSVVPDMNNELTNVKLKEGEYIMAR